MRIIELEKHNKRWSSDFDKEVATIKGILSEKLMAAFHIGSTAISGIRAKPVIDILLEVRSIKDMDIHNKAFEVLGYEAKGENGIKGRRYFRKGKNARTHHIHIFESGNPEIERHRLFVEFMNAHPDRAAEYEILKMELSSKYKQESEKYSQGKSVFIHNIDLEALKWKHS